MGQVLASRLRDRIDFVRITRTSKPTGGNIVTETPIATGVHAEVIAVSGSEAVKEKLLRGIRVYRIVTRWRDDIQQTDQVRFGSELLNIRAALPDRRKGELVIHADSEAQRA